MEFRKLGKPVRGPSKELDTFPKPEAVTLVRFTTDEVTSLCPVTGQPDFSTVILEYSPNQLCIESKSLKLYFWSFRHEALMAEKLASTIAADIAKAIRPRWVRVEVRQNVRGGLQLTAVAEWPKTETDMPLQSD
jgi:7-cyano-7-deazaguanine reductase